MYGQIASAVIVALIQLLPPAQTHIIRSPSSTPSPSPPQPQPLLPLPLPLPLSAQTCPSRTTPKSFSLSGITYLRYETSQYTSPAPPNTTQLVFEITNPATGISTGCALQTVMSPSGDWIDDDESWWYTCLERTITIDDDDDDDDGKKKYPVRTSARFDWDEWRLAVNQTWVCEER
ncbi:hypothetical protein F5B21DRAFT_491749 [Xylaria acuta]|nr:hypothetical protein F5B21DRAFT_491749 [Xylaria acuta]